MGEERAYVEGWQAAADYIGMSLSNILRYRKELKEKGIARRRIKGRPPNRRVVIQVWKNLLQVWDMERN